MRTAGKKACGFCLPYMPLVHYLSHVACDESVNGYLRLGDKWSTEVRCRSVEAEGLGTTLKLSHAYNTGCQLN